VESGDGHRVILVSGGITTGGDTVASAEIYCKERKV
jgi:hypothetical protein